MLSGCAQPHHVAQAHWAVDDGPAVAQFGNQSGHDLADGTALVITGAPPPCGVRPHAARGDALEDRFGLTVGGGAPGEFEAQPVVRGVFGGQVGNAIPFRFAQVGVNNNHPVQSVSGAGVLDDNVKAGLRVLAGAAVH